MIKTERKNVILIHGLPADTAVFLTSLDFKNGATNLITTKYYSAETIPIVYTPQFDQYACVDALISLISCPAAAEAAELVELRSKTEANVLIAVAIVHPFEKAWTCAELHDKRIHYLDCGTEFVYWDLNAELHINRRIELHDFGVDDVEEETAVERVGAALAANVWDGMRMKSEVRPRNTNANAIPIVKDVAIENESNSSSNEGNFQSTCESSLGDIETLNDEEIEVVQPEIDFKDIFELHSSLFGSLGDSEGFETSLEALKEVRALAESKPLAERLILAERVALAFLSLGNDSE